MAVGASHDRGTRTHGADEHHRVEYLRQDCGCCLAVVAEDEAEAGFAQPFSTGGELAKIQERKLMRRAGPKVFKASSRRNRERRRRPSGKGACALVRGEADIADFRSKRLP